MEPTNGNAEPLDPFHYFEVLDRTGIVADLFDSAIAAHPLVETDEELQDLVEQVEDLLGAIYQRAGTLLDEKLDEEESADE